MRQGQALLDAVQRLQGGKTGEGLARALCETALDISGARGAALVRWSAEEEAGGGAEPFHGREHPDGPVPGSPGRTGG